MSLSLSVTTGSPFSTSSMKSGVMCCTLLSIRLPKLAPGLGLSFTISPIASFSSSLSMFSFFFMLSYRFLLNISKQLPIIFLAVSMLSVDAFLFSCTIRHSCSVVVPTPAGSSSCTTFIRLSIFSTFISSPVWKAMSSAIDSASLLRYPSSSMLPIMNSAIFLSSSLSWRRFSWSDR